MAPDTRDHLRMQQCTVWLICLTLVSIVGVAAHAAEKTCTFRWDPPAANADGSELVDLGGYRLYTEPVAGSHVRVSDTGDACIPFGTSLLDMQGQVTSTCFDVPLANLPDPSAPRYQVRCNERSFWVVTAYDTWVPAANESDVSNEVLVPDVTAPGTPGGEGLRLEEITETTEELQIRTTRTVRYVDVE